MEIADLEKINLEDFEGIVKLKLQLQELNDTIAGGLRCANLAEYRNTYVVNAQDSLDASYPMYTHFNIISEMTKIVSVKLSFWFLNFRAYSTAASSDGAVSSASGGGETPTSSSDGDSIPTSSSDGDSIPTSSSQGAASGGGSTSGSGGSTTPTSSTSGKNTAMIFAGSYTSVTGVGDQSASGALYTTSTVSVATYDHTHTVTIGNHTHTTPAHTHPGHTHTVTIAAHTHTVTIAAHTHTVTIAAHTHTGGAHTHGITYGIFEDSTTPTVQAFISRDNGLTYSLAIGSYTEDQENLDITSFIDTVGSKMIKFESDARTRLSVQVTVKLDIKAR